MRPSPSVQMNFASGAMLGAVLAIVASFTAVEAQDRRRTLRTPGIVVETGTPTAATHAIRFTRDGQHLLAAGDDKVVRQWAIDDEGKLSQDEVKTFRWAIYREQRGRIYALDLSPDEAQQFVAIGGTGLRNGALCILNRETGEVVAGVTDPKQGSDVQSLAYSPSGDAIAYGTFDGRIFLWKPNAGKNNIQPLGGHGAAAGRTKALRWLADDLLVSVAEDGSLREWNPRRADGGPQPSSALLVKAVRHAVFSEDGKWLAASGQRRIDNRWCLEIRSLEDKSSKTVVLREGQYPTQIAFNRDASKLCVGAHREPENRKTFKPVIPVVYLYDIAAEKFQVDDLPKPTFVVESLAFSPDEGALVMAGGDNHEIVVWDMAKSRMSDIVRSPGGSIWQVALSKDSAQLGFRHTRNHDPPSFNAEGEGPWRVFNLRQRVWAREAERRSFAPVQNIAETQEWRIASDLTDMHIWHVVSKTTGKSWPLPLDRNRDSRPRCFTFLPDTRNGRDQLVVGHMWGMSLFELQRNAPPRLKRMLIGHQGEVTSVGVSDDRTLLVSASRDQTISGWTLAPWPNQDELGVSFERDGGSLVVQRVAAGSPGWEAGLTRGDRIEKLARNAQLLDRGVAQWEAALRAPIPGQELYFEVRRAGTAAPIPMLTTVRQRPLWRFFPARGDEWVIWRWRDFFYDCSVKGDDFIGWQINGDTDETPSFTAAEQHRERFHRPEKIEEMLTSMTLDPLQVAIPELVKPDVRLTVNEGPGGDLVARVEAKVRDGLPSTEPLEVTLWINDHKFQQWIRPVVPLSEAVHIPKSALRSGRNRVIAQAYSAFGVRADSQEAIYDTPISGEKPRLLALSVGINDYSRSKPTSSRGGRWSPLTFAAQDAVAVREVLDLQKTSGHYSDVRTDVLTDAEASRSAIIARLKQVAEVSHPDDLFVLFMAGHGWAEKKGESSYDSQSFAFVTPTFDVMQPLGTGLRFSLDKDADDIGEETLFQLLARIPCRKLVLLDCCHSGGSTTMLRNLTPGRKVGPMVIVACRSDELAWELIFKGHGAFTAALLESLSESFTTVDEDGDGVLNTQELSERLAYRVPELIEMVRYLLELGGLRPSEKQRPQMFVPDDSITEKLFGATKLSEQES